MALQEFKIEMLFDIHKKINDLIIRVEKHITEHETGIKLQKRFYAFIGVLSALLLITTTLANLFITFTGK
jgi:hypothetical protein